MNNTDLNPSLPPSHEDDEDDLPFDNRGGDSSGASWAMFHPSTQFPAPETWEQNRRLDYTAQYGYPFYTEGVNIVFDPNLNTFMKSAFRRRLIERITEALPEGFSPPTRKIGEEKVTWENDLHILSLGFDFSLVMGCKYREGIPTMRDQARRVFNALVGEYDLTVFSVEEDRDVPYTP